MEKKFVSETDNDYPPCPEKPSESDCCGSGCSVCVFDIYQKQMIAWKQQVENLKLQNISQDDDTSRVVLCQLRFLPFQVVRIQQHTHNTFLFTFQAVTQASFIQIQQPLELKLGQYLIMQSSAQVLEKPVITRAYTPISGKKSSSLGQFKVLIKLYSEGKMSHFLKTIKQDDIIFWKGPYGTFEYVPNTFQLVIMFCAGTGIAPMFNIARAVVKNEDDETFIHLLFACKSYEDILLRQKLQKLAAYWNFSVEIFLSCAQQEEAESHALYHENIRTHKINRDVVIKELNGKSLNQILVLICGTKLFNKDMMTYVKDAGVSDSNIFLF